MKTFIVKFTVDDERCGVDSRTIALMLSHQLHLIASRVYSGEFGNKYRTIHDANGEPVGVYGLKDGDYVVQEVK